MTKDRKPSQFADAAVYCTCHDPACRNCGHCVDNIQSADMRRPTRKDLLRWLASRA